VDSKRSIKQHFREILEAEKPQVITESLWHGLLLRLAPISESYLRELLRNAGVAIEQPYAGVRQHTFEDLEESLRELLRVYQQATVAGNGDRARYCRRQVIGAKDRAKFLAQNPNTLPYKQAEKQEMVQWMLVWLENPEVFPAWVEARKNALAAGPAVAD
jgi:hypothetical protein